MIGDTILILPDASDAAGVLAAAKAALPDNIANPTPEPVDIGTGGVTASGNSPDGSKSVTILLFTEGKAFATLEFDGPPDQPAPTDFVTDVAQKQHAAIKKGCPGLTLFDGGIPLLTARRWHFCRKDFRTASHCPFRMRCNLGIEFSDWRLVRSFSVRWRTGTELALVALD